MAGVDQRGRELAEAAIWLGRVLLQLMPKEAEVGAMTWSDSARHRLSVFTREEAKAIVAYMTYKSERDSAGLDRARIDAALNEFWFDRAENAPTRAVVEAHVREEERFTLALQPKREEKQ
jgi:predicted RNA polymerase sigma factor